MASNWEKYEEVATYLLGKIKQELKLDSVEGKQKLLGRETGTEWEVDAKGVVEESSGIVIIECRQYRKSKQDQDKMAAFAYRIKDTKSEGGIIVSPTGLQSGAKKVAEANNIQSIELDANSTMENFIIKFLNKIFVGATLKMEISVRASATIIKKCQTCGNFFEQINNELFCPKCNI